MWTMARATGADLVWRVGKNAWPHADTPLPDGSYISHPSEKDRRHKSRGTAVRVVNYALDGVEDIDRLVTSILDAEAAPARELAALCHERWEIETALDELKTHPRGSRIVLRSRTLDLVRQELYGLMMLHYAVRTVMHEAAIKADRPGPTILPSCCPRDPTQAYRHRRHFPLGRHRHGMIPS